MVKKVFGRKLSRGRSAREALFASLISNLIEKGRIVTTKAKAKSIRDRVEKYLNLAKEGGLSVQRRITADLDNRKQAASILFKKKFAGLRIINLPPRKGDNAQMARVELIEETKNEDIPAKTKRN